VRRIFQTLIKWYEHSARSIVYIDESGFAHDMPRTHGYAPVGERCYGTQDWHAKGRTNAIGALIGKNLLTVGLFPTNVNADIFTAWVVQDLLPKLPPKAVIVMDNATFHKRQDTQDMIRKAGHSLLFLPPYSPDLNPIEQKWAHTKAIRKKLRCSIEQLFKIESIYLG
jgi:transposase